MAMIKIKNTKVLKKILGAIVVIGISLIASSIWQAVMEKSEESSPVGRLVEVNSHKIHLYESGEGNFTTIFLTGSGTPSAYTDFYYLQDTLKEYAKTLSFDHPGFGWSEASHVPRTVDVLVNELYRLLNNSNQKPPYILVAHSLSSLEAIRFAQIYPDEVEGIVFMDGGSPESYVNGVEFESFMINRLCAMLRITGINRFLGEVGVKLPIVGADIRYSTLPDSIKEIDELMYYKFLGSNNNLDLIKHINENARTVIKNGRLTDIPILVLSSESGDGWEKTQQELLNWSNRGTYKMIENSSHYIHWSNKEVVISEIVKFLISTIGESTE